MVDVHQHLWPDALVEALRARTGPPRLDGWTLHLVGEPPHEVDPADHDPAKPVVDYVTQMHAAWWAWHAAGRTLFPRLRICFAAGAGLAPVHHERAEARGGRLGRVDPDVFVDTSSYGPRALDALIRVLGIDTVVLGSDRPYAEPADPGLGQAASYAIRCANPRRLLEGGLP